MKIEFTVIVPVYNIEKYLPACVESLISQPGDFFEVILIDDGSPDNSPAICDKYAQADHRVSVIHTPNKGVSNARNIGIDHAAGKWIIFVDGDDWVSEDLFEFLHKYTEEHREEDVLFFGYEEDHNGTVLAKSDFSDVKSFLIPGDFANCQFVILNKNYRGQHDYRTLKPNMIWGKCYRTQFLNDHSFRFTDNVVRGQDNLFNFRVWEYAQSAIVIPKIFYHYRVNASSISHNFNPYIMEINADLYNALRALIIQFKKGETFEKMLYNKGAILAANTVILNFCNSNNTKTLLEKRREFRICMKSEPYQTSLKLSDLSGFPISEKILINALKLRAFIFVSVMFSCYSLLVRFKNLLSTSTRKQ